MLGSVIDIALRQRLLVFLAALGLAAWGINAYLKIPIDAFPDVAPVQVLVTTRAPGLAPEELESRVTAPIEIAMRGIPNLTGIRSQTRYSISLITLEFVDGTDIYWARAQVNERLQDTHDQLPPGSNSSLAPIVTPLGEMMMFTIDSETLNSQEMRSLVDWVIRPALRGLPGVADINVLGGYVRTFEVAPSAPAMAARDITTTALENAIISNNRNDGAGRVREGEEVLLVRSDGRIKTIEDVRNIVVETHGTSAIRVGDVADVHIGAMPRNGVVTTNAEREAIWALVLALRGANAKAIVNEVKHKFVELKPRLPEKTSISLFYDRNDLIEKAVSTVQEVLIEAVILVAVMLVLFLGNLRAALVVSVILPLATLITFGILGTLGYSANIMSLGGLAIAIGLLVDCAVVVVENVEHRIAHSGKADVKTRMLMTLEGAQEVAVPLVSGVVIIITVFMPLVALQGLEGRLFRPVALTIAFALGSALILAMTVIPALAGYLLKSGVGKEPWLVRKMHQVYDPMLERAMKRPLVVAGGIALGLVAAIFAYLHVGQTFMPVMDEGTPVVSVRKFPTISVEEAAQTDLRIQRELMTQIPEIRRIMARAGADELGLDPAGLNETDMFMTLAPRREWRGKGTPWLLEEFRKVLDTIPGISYAFAQPIDLRVQEMIIGARGDVVVKIFADEIPTLNRIARDIADTIRKIPGATDVFTLRNAGLKYFTVKIDRDRAGRIGINATEIQDALRVWVDGRQLGIVLEGTVRTPLFIRGEDRLRASPAELARVPIVRPNGGIVELSQVADVQIEDGPIQIIREGGQRFATVLVNVRGRDLVGFVDEAKAAVASAVRLSPEITLTWGGQFENQQRAAARLAIVLPIALGLIFLLLYLTFGSLRQAVLVFCNVPFATIGGIVALWASGEFLSVPASVGFIALIGIAVLNGVVMITYINDVVIKGPLPFHEAVKEGARRRLRPVMLTATIAALGLTPFLFASGPGSEIQRPLAIVVIGGLVTATLLTLIMLPILYDRFGVPAAEKIRIDEWKRRAAAGQDPEVHPPAHGPDDALAAE